MTFITVFAVIIVVAMVGLPAGNIGYYEYQRWKKEPAVPYNTYTNEYS